MCNLITRGIIYKLKIMVYKGTKFTHIFSQHPSSESPLTAMCYESVRCCLRPCFWLIVFQGQFCDYCNAADPSKAHPITNAIDGTESWWQSPPLSMGLKYNEVNVTLDLGQVSAWAMGWAVIISWTCAYAVQLGEMFELVIFASWHHFQLFCLVYVLCCFTKLTVFCMKWLFSFRNFDDGGSCHWDHTDVVMVYFISQTL